MKKKRWQGKNRRKKPRSKDGLYRLVIGLASTGWVALLFALILYGEARPELETGIQRFWGAEIRTEWSQQYASYLLMVLRFCLLSSLIAVLLNFSRNRRKQDRFGINLLALIIISGLSLVTLAYVADIR